MMIEENDNDVLTDMMKFDNILYDTLYYYNLLFLLEQCMERIKQRSRSGEDAISMGNDEDDDENDDDILLLLCINKCTTIVSIEYLQAIDYYQRKWIGNDDDDDGS